jgi:hypothetical protein
MLPSCSGLEGSGIAESVMVLCEWCGAGGEVRHRDLGRWIGRLAAQRALSTDDGLWLGFGLG